MCVYRHIISNIHSQKSVADDFEFLDSQLLLFAKMCQVLCVRRLLLLSSSKDYVLQQGNNERCIKALDKDGLRYVTFEQALWCVRCPDLQPCVASKFVDLIKGGYASCVHSMQEVLMNSPSLCSDVCGRWGQQSCTGEPLTFVCESRILFAPVDPCT